MSHIYHVHMTQRVSSDPHWTVNCTAYCAAMLINDATLGGLRGVTGGQVRYWSNEPQPDPGSPGLNIKQCIDVAYRQYRVNIADRTGNGWGTLMAELQKGRRILLQIDYASLQGSRCQANGNFGHAVALVRDAGSNIIEASDPLCGSSKVYSENLMRHAAEVFGNQHGGKLWWAMTRPIPRLV